MLYFEVKLKGKKGIFLGFTGIRLVSFIISALVFIVLVVIAFTLFNLLTSGEEEAQALAFLEDATSKIKQLQRDDSVTMLKSYGKLEENVVLESVDGEDKKDCAGRRACLCLCREMCNKKIIRCKAFKGRVIPITNQENLKGEWEGFITIKKDDKDIKIEGPEKSR